MCGGESPAFHFFFIANFYYAQTEKFWIRVKRLVEGQIQPRCEGLATIKLKNFADAVRVLYFVVAEADEEIEELEKILEVFFNLGVIPDQGKDQSQIQWLQCKFVFFCTVKPTAHVEASGEPTSSFPRFP